jgi:mycothiol synthase
MTLSTRRARPNGDVRVRLEPSRDLEAELPAIWRVADAARRADGEIDRSTLEGFSAYYRHMDHCDPATDLVLGWRGSTVVAYARVEWNDTTDGERWYEAVCLVDPAVRRHGVGRRLLGWTEARRREIVMADETRGVALDRPRWVSTYVHDRDVGGGVLLRSNGYAPFRRFHSMRRPALSDIPDPSLPAGIEIRSMTTDRDAIERVIAADTEAFQDHFGSVDDTATVVRQILDDPSTDTSLWVIAYDGGDVAGGGLNAIRAGHDGTPTGWLDSIFTRRAWRRRGLARALIARSLTVLRDRGVSTAALGVDSANPNQALHLYESCGFEVASSSTAYRKPVAALRGGGDETTTGAPRSAVAEVNR